jgi:UDP-N-acetylglucosamine--N-acetylmuramyl-(pentapeptide) pyrophosphoryl-undecaprenol N-acetylglucosamine transferase
MPFINDMAKAYAWANLIICRAGALTIAEICAAGIAAILVPYPQAVDDHQTINARFLSTQNAAILLPQEQFSVVNLSDLLIKLDPPQLLELAQAAWDLRKVDATKRVIEEIMNYEL